MFTIQYKVFTNLQNPNSQTLIRLQWDENHCLAPRTPFRKGLVKLAENITDTQHSLTCCFLCIQGAQGIYQINNPA